jgi:hypothetical protein
VRGGGLWLALVAVLGACGVGGIVGCTKTNTRYCADRVQNDCAKSFRDAGTDMRRDAVAETGDAPDAGDVAEAGDAREDAEVAMDLVPEKPTCSVSSCMDDTKAICEVDAGTCRTCLTGAECKARDLTKPGCAGGTCYECATNAECTVAATKPICDGHKCRSCAADTECGGPGICDESGKCLLEEQVIHLDANATGCAAADGTAAKPFCSSDKAVAALAPARATIIVHGPNGQIALNTTAAPILVVGKKNAGGESASLSVGVGAGLAVISGDVLVRDITAVAGTSANSKGIVASGATTKVRLLRVNVSTGTGIGVQADTGVSLSMNRCIVQGNTVGGLLVNGAAYDVANSVFANNGYGVKFELPKANSRFRSNTVVGNTGNAATCDSANPQILMVSIVVGFVDTCTLSDSITVAPAFDPARPFHLTAESACPPTNDPISFPPDDIDGDLRSAPPDCGADQFK